MATTWPISGNVGSTVTLEVSIAWGADLTADPSTWSWTEITTDVFDDPGIEMVRGRADEASTSQPAECEMELDNRTAAYSVGGESSNWPNVKQGVPVRVRVNPGTGLVTLFQGTATGFTPIWPYHNTPRVKLSASGTLRRLGQGQAPFQSSMRREVMADTRTVSYWTCEEGDRSNAFLPSVGSYFMTWYATPPDLAADDFFEASTQLPRLKLSYWTTAVDPATTGDWMVRFLIRMDPDETRAGADGASVVTIFTTGTAAVWALRYYHGSEGQFNLKVYDDALGLLYDSGNFISYMNQPGMGALVSIAGEQTGGDVLASYAQSALLDDSVNTFGFDDTIAGRTAGNVTSIWVNQFSNLDETTLGHLTVYNDALSFADGLGAARAWRSEYADVRLARLAEETGETIDLNGVSWVTMGPQTPGTFLDLLREVETADGGVLYDGETHGLSYQSRENRENRTADLTLNATGSQVKPEFQPVHDDQRIRNRAYVTRKSAGQFQADASGALSPDAIGIYDTSVTASLYDDNAAQDLAGWMVHLGTVEGYRYPQVTVNLVSHPSLIPYVLALKPGHRIDITNLDSALTGHPGPSTLSLAVEGVAHRLTAMTWMVTFRCSRYDPWNVIELDDESLSPVALISSGTAATSNNTTLAVPVPSDYDVDDLLVIVASIRNSGTGTVNTPTGWTVLKTFGNVSVFGFIQPREFADWVGSTVSVSFTGGVANADCLAQMFAVRGTKARRLTNLADVLHTSATQLNGSAQDCAMPAMTVSVDNCGILAIVWKQDDFTSASNPYGYTDFPIVTNSTAGDDACMFAAWGVQETAANLGAGTYTITGGAAAISRAVILAFLPDPTPPEVGRLDTSGSTLNGSIAQGATSMSVATTGAPGISYVGIGAIAAGNNAALTPAFPSGLVDGDLLIAVAAIRNSGTGTCDTPSDWTELVDFGNVSVFAWHYNAAQGDTSVPLFFSGGVANATTLGQVFAFRGVEQNIADVLDGSATQLNGAAQNIAVPGLVGSTDEVTSVVIGWKQDDWTSVATLSGQLFTEISDNPSALGDDAGLEIQYRIGGFSGAKTVSATSLTVTGGAAAISRAIVLQLVPSTFGVWTTDADDYPMNLDVGGVKITATACSDGYSPQTMTISAAPVARTSGVPVKLWNPPTLARNMGL